MKALNIRLNGQDTVAPDVKKKEHSLYLVTSYNVCVIPWMALKVQFCVFIWIAQNSTGSYFVIISWWWPKSITGMCSHCDYMMSMFAVIYYL